MLKYSKQPIIMNYANQPTMMNYTKCTQNLRQKLKSVQRWPESGDISIILTLRGKETTKVNQQEKTSKTLSILDCKYILTIADISEKIKFGWSSVLFTLKKYYSMLSFGQINQKTVTRIWTVSWKRSTKAQF